jgi:hypothetical protein
LPFKGEPLTFDDGARTVSGRRGDADRAAINPPGESSGRIDIFDSRSHVKPEDSARAGQVDAVADAQEQELAESEIGQFVGCRDGAWTRPR